MADVLTPDGATRGRGGGATTTSAGHPQPERTEKRKPGRNRKWGILTSVFMSTVEFSQGCFNLISSDLTNQISAFYIF